MQYEIRTKDRIRAYAKMVFRNPLLVGIILGPLGLVLNVPYTGIMVWTTAFLQVAVSMLLRFKVF